MVYPPFLNRKRPKTYKDIKDRACPMISLQILGLACITSHNPGYEVF
jgi:hypothetical protein